MTTFTALLALAVAAQVAVDAKPTFISLIPNGNGVDGVSALGHTSTSGGGALNAFGEAFNAAGQTWTEALCKADSDGDGQTNGEELGDPCCEWAAGATPKWTAGVSHPGDASSKSDPSLWASVTCDSSSTPSTTTATPSPSSSAATVSTAAFAGLVAGVVAAHHV